MRQQRFHVGVRQRAPVSLSAQRPQNLLRAGQLVFFAGGLTDEDAVACDSVGNTSCVSRACHEQRVQVRQGSQARDARADVDHGLIHLTELIFHRSIELRDERRRNPVRTGGDGDRRGLQQEFGFGDVRVYGEHRNPRAVNRNFNLLALQVGGQRLAE